MVAFCRLGCGVGRPNVCSRINRAGIEALGDSSGDGTRDGETKRERGREESKRKEMEGKCKSVEKRVKKRENKGWKYIYICIFIGCQNRFLWNGESLKLNGFWNAFF